MTFGALAAATLAAAAVSAAALAAAAVAAAVATAVAASAAAARTTAGAPTLASAVAAAAVAAASRGADLAVPRLLVGLLYLEPPARKLSLHGPLYVRGHVGRRRPRGAVVPMEGPRRQRKPQGSRALLPHARGG